VDRILALASRDARDSLIAAVKQWSDEAREAFHRLLVAAAPDGSAVSRAPAGADPDGALQDADRLARAYAEAWADDFLVRQVALFRAWTPEQRRERLAADSLRRTGATVYRNNTESARRIWRQAENVAASIGDSSGVARAVGNIGAAFYTAGWLDSAEHYLSRAHELAVSSGDFLTAANALTNLGNLCYDDRRLARATTLYDRAITMRERTGDARGMAADLHNLALVRVELGDYEPAREEFEQARSINRRHGYRSEEARNLVGLADLAMLTGEYAASARLLNDAFKIYREVDDRSGMVEVTHREGLLATRRGAYGEAARALWDATDLYETAGRLADAAEASLDASIALAASGRLGDARTRLDRAERLAARGVGGRRLLAEIALTRADIALRLNDPAAASRQYRRASQLYREADDPRGQLESRQGEAVTLVLRQDYARAVTELEALERTPAATSDRHFAANVQLLLGYARDLAGDINGARKALDRAESAFAELGASSQQAMAFALRGDLELRAGLPGTAESHYRAGIARISETEPSDAAWRLHAGLAEIHERRGDLRGASDELQEAIKHIESIASSAAARHSWSGYLADKWDVYFRSAFVDHLEGRPVAAFETSERMRARHVQDLLARGRIDATDVPAAGLIAREQDLRRRIENLTSETDAYGGSARRRDPTREMPLATADRARRLTELRTAHSDLLREIRTIDPAYADMLEPLGRSLPSVRQMLQPGSALLEYLVGESSTLLFVVTADTLMSLDLAVGRQELRGLVDFARTFLASTDATESRELWKAPLQRLYEHLIAPASQALQGIRRLQIVPHAELHYLPFHALVDSNDGEAFLIERFEVTYAPSSLVSLRLSSPAAGGPWRSAVGMAPLTAELPSTRREVSSLDRAFGDRARILEDDRATETYVRQQANSIDILHLASRGLVSRWNPLYSYVELRPDSQNDGRLEVHEVFGLDLNARLVVLSACETALAAGLLEDVPAGEEWVGLVRAFLYAGASNVLATLWQVEDRATGELMDLFYRELAHNRSPSTALAAAQRKMLRNPDTRDPFFWAAFSLAGGL
jgi:CHAT domain-containing protein/tetratricopeptide (TPR) repeat protein